tara:strand:+ start:883 stop:1455 length:573 start_codon:yes stop_codon:yes gene_type:complete
MRFSTSKTEQRDLLKAWAAISIAFAIAMSGLNFSFAFITAIILSALTVGIGFLAHELAHKFVAQKYGCWAEFRSNDQMLFLAIVMSFFGFIFAAPGAVMISGHVTRERNGIISLAGPLTNYALAIIFLILGTLPLGALFQSITFYGVLINSWLGLFNLIPFGNFDGIKILRWNRLYYGLMVVGGFILLFI